MTLLWGNCASIQQMTGSSPRCSLFLCTLSFYGITKWALKYISPISIVFKNQISQYKINSFNCVLGYFLYLLFIVPLQKTFPFRFHVFFSKTPFFIYISQNISRFVGVSLCIPLISMDSIKISEFHNIFHFIKKK